MTAIERSDSFYHYNFSSSFDMVNRFLSIGVWDWVNTKPECNCPL